MPPRHLYLLTLEVIPLKVGEAYDELPLHCTLMHRFWSSLSPEELTAAVHDLFDGTPPLTLNAYECKLLGPKQVAVSLLELTKELDALNMRLYELLNQLTVEYTAPEWVGKGHVFHVTERENARLEIGSKHVSKAAYLIEVEVPGYGHKRVVRARFELNGRV